MDNRDDQRPASATRRGSVPKRRDRKPLEADEMETGAERCVVDEGLGWDVSEGAGPYKKFCAGTCFTVKACVLFHEHRKLVWCDLD